MVQRLPDGSRVGIRHRSIPVASDSSPSVRDSPTNPGPNTGSTRTIATRFRPAGTGTSRIPRGLTNAPIFCVAFRFCDSCRTGRRSSRPDPGVDFPGSCSVFPSPCRHTVSSKRRTAGPRCPGGKRDVLADPSRDRQRIHDLRISSTGSGYRRDRVQPAVSHRG